MILLYRRTESAPDASDLDAPNLKEQLDQRRKVNAFFEELRQKKRFATGVSSADDFESRLENDLKHQISLRLRSSALAPGLVWLVLFLLCAITLMPPGVDRPPSYITNFLMMLLAFTGALMALWACVASLSFLTTIFNQRVLIESKRLRKGSEALQRRVPYWLGSYHDIICAGLSWFRNRFGLPPAWWKGIDFCLFCSFVYSPIVFFFGLLILGGDPNIGDLRISVFELSDKLDKTCPSTGLIVIIPFFLFVSSIYAIHYAAQRLASIYGASAKASLALMVVISVLIALLLGVLGFGAGFVTLSVAIGALNVWWVVGAGFVCMASTLIATFLLGVIAYGAAQGHETMSAIAYWLHELHVNDIHRFILLWILLPGVNAFYDFMSWIRSLCLGSSLLKHYLKPGMRAALNGRHYIASLWFILVDALLAVICLVLLAWTIAFCLSVVEGSLRVFEGSSNDKACDVDLSSNFMSLATHPWSKGFWFTVMLLSTLIPTALHMFALGFGLAVAVHGTLFWREHPLDLAEGLSQDKRNWSFVDSCNRAARGFGMQRMVLGPLLGVLGLAVLVTPLLAVNFWAPLFGTLSKAATAGAITGEIACKLMG